MRANEAETKDPFDSNSPEPFSGKRPHSPWATIPTVILIYHVRRAAIELSITCRGRSNGPRTLSPPRYGTTAGFGGAASSVVQPTHPWAHRRGRQNENVPVDPVSIDTTPRSLLDLPEQFTADGIPGSHSQMFMGPGPAGYLRG